MHLDDDFQIRKILPDWAPFSIGLGFSWENKCIMVNIMYLQVIYVTTLIIHSPPFTGMNPHWSCAIPLALSKLHPLSWTHASLAAGCRCCVMVAPSTPSHRRIGIETIPPTPSCLSTCWRWVWSSHLRVFRRVSVGFDPYTFASCDMSALGSLHLHIFRHVGIGILTPSRLSTHRCWILIPFVSFLSKTCEIGPHPSQEGRGSRRACHGGIRLLWSWGLPGHPWSSWDRLLVVRDFPCFCGGSGVIDVSGRGMGRGIVKTNHNYYRGSFS